VPGLLEDGRAKWRGKSANLGWAKRHVPIGVAASGPRALRMAGRVADVVWACTGIGREAVAQAMELIESGAHDASRSVDDLEIWWLAVLGVGNTYESAVDDIKCTLASQMFRFTLENKAVPPHLNDSVRNLVGGFHHHVHMSPGQQNPNAKLVEDLGLTDYLAGRQAVAGTVDQCVQRIKDAASYGEHRHGSPWATRRRTLRPNACNKSWPGWGTRS